MLAVGAVRVGSGPVVQKRTVLAVLVSVGRRLPGCNQFDDRGYRFDIVTLCRELGRWVFDFTTHRENRGFSRQPILPPLVARPLHLYTPRHFIAEMTARVHRAAMRNSWFAAGR